MYGAWRAAGQARSPVTGRLHGDDSSVSGALEEFFAGVDEEFGVGIGPDRELLRTPGDVIDYVVGETAPTDGMTDDEHRDHVAAIVGELMAQALGITRYGEDSRFREDLHVR
jgi:hypothetical protein